MIIMLGQQQGGLPFTPFRGGTHRFNVQPKVTSLPFTPFRGGTHRFTYQPKVSGLSASRQRGGRVAMGGIVKRTLAQVGKKALITGLSMLPLLVNDLSQRKQPVMSTLKQHGKKALRQLLGSTADIVKEDVLGMTRKRKAPLARLSTLIPKKKRTLKKRRHHSKV